MKLNLRRRKVQLVRGTFWVSLPTIWAQNMDLKKGDIIAVHLTRDGRSLVLTKEACSAQ